MFEPLLSSALNSGGLGQYRTVSADTLSVWAQRAVQSCTASTDAAGQLSPVITDKDAEKIFSFVCDFWTDSGAALGNALKELFVKLISLLTKLRPAPELTGVLHKWTQRVLKFSKTQRVLYFTLEILVKIVGGSYVLEIAPDFPSQALLHMGSNALANPIGKTLYALYSSILTELAGSTKAAKIPTHTVSEWTNMWAPAGRSALMNKRTREHVFTYFLPQMFRRLPASLKLFIEPFMKPFMNVDSETSEDEISVLVGCLKVGQELDILDLSKADNNIISADFLESLFYHSSPSLRISALSLAVTSPQGSKPIAPYVLEIIKRSIDNFFVESDPGFRNQFYGFMRQLVFRVRGSSYAMARESRKSKEKGDTQKAEAIDEQISQIKEFCQWFVNYLELCVRPGSPYQYLFTGILMITLLVQSGLDERVSSKYYEKQHIPFPFHVPVYNHKMVRLLVDNIANNYEDIRSGAAKILKMAPLPVPLIESYKDVETISDKVYDTISGMRGREGDAGARGAELVFHLYGALPADRNASIEKSMDFLEQLIGNLEQQVKYAQTDLSTAVREHPIHGYYSALRFIIENINFKQYIVNDAEVARWSKYVQRLTDTIFDIWNIVESILTHDSPEGNLPEELESNFQPGLEALYGPATQVILSYSWRAVKESTSLLNALLDRIPVNETIFPQELVLASGNVILAQLASVRHRGAFSSVYPTFISCCRRCNKTPGLENQPSTWLSDNMALIKVKAQYITRRSGGLPFLITAVLTAETDPKKPLLTATFNNLYAIAKSPAVSSAEEKLDLPQVHAFNCIKALFVETELSASSAYFVDQALELAITSFSDPIWAIRNCAVMLFTALQNRLFGTARVSSSRHVVSTVSARLFFSKYKTVRQVLLNILTKHVEALEEKGGRGSSVETVFPVLSLLARLEGTNGYDGLDAFQPLILVCLKSRIWKTREMAARTLPPLLNEQDMFQFSTELVSNASLGDQNGLHGACLAVLNIVAKAQEKFLEQRALASGKTEQAETHAVPETFVELLCSRFDELVATNRCAETALAYFRILKSVYTFNLQEESGSGYNVLEKVVVPFCFEEWAGVKTGLNAVDRCLQSEMAELALTTLFRSGELANDDRAGYITGLVLDTRYEVQQTALSFLEPRLAVLSPIQAQALAEVCWELFSDERAWDQVRGPAVRVFSKLQTVAPTPTTAAGGEDHWTRLYGSVSAAATEEINETCLHALGIFTGQAYAASADTSSLDKTEKWLELVQKHGHENEAFPTREAAFNSLVAFLSATAPTSTQKQQVTPVYVDALLQLHFFLSDDDDDIRSAAALYASQSVLGLPFAGTPVHCEGALLAHICSLASSTCDQDILAHLEKRLFTQFRGVHLRAWADLAEAVKQRDDELLFAVERQNIYRDELRRVDQFAGALTTTTTTTGKLSASVGQEYQAWALDAVQAVLDLPTHAEQEPDGVFGWAKDPNLFLSLYRIKAGLDLGRELNVLPDDDDKVAKGMKEVREKMEALCVHSDLRW